MDQRLLCVARVAASEPMKGREMLMVELLLNTSHVLIVTEHGGVLRFEVYAEVLLELCRPVEAR